MTSIRFAFAFFLLVAASAAQVADEGADLVIIGRVITLDPTLPEAGAIVVRGGHIERLTSAESAGSRITPRTRVIRLAGDSVVIPGFIESHGHLRSLGKLARTINLADATSAEDIRIAVSKAAKDLPKGAWILGRGWNHERFTQKEWPTLKCLEEFTENPIALSRTDGHALLANRRALELANISRASPNPTGGEVMKDPSGEPTGILIDRAMEPVSALAESDPSPQLIIGDYVAAEKSCLAEGVTSFIDAGTTPGELMRLATMIDEGRFQVRVHALLYASTPADLAAATARPPIHDLANGRLSVRGLKISADGALGSRGAALTEPYSDRPSSTGLLITPPPFLVDAARRALANGWQLCVHSIGDRANRVVLDAMEAALRENPVKDHRFRIEHAQIVDPTDLPRFAQLGVIASIQPCHATSDGPWAPKRIGAARYASMGYPARSLLDAGARICFGTDVPVEPISPIRNLVAAITRCDPDGVLGGPFRAEERLNRKEALLGATAWGAYASFAENRRGTLSPGMDADLVILSANPLTAEPSSLAKARVLTTIVAGRIVYEAAR